MLGFGFIVLLLMGLMIGGICMVMFPLCQKVYVF